MRLRAGQALVSMQEPDLVDGHHHLHKESGLLLGRNVDAPVGVVVAVGGEHDLAPKVGQSVIVEAEVGEWRMQWKGMNCQQVEHATLCKRHGKLRPDAPIVAIIGKEGIEAAPGRVLVEPANDVDTSLAKPESAIHVLNFHTERDDDTRKGKVVGVGKGSGGASVGEVVLYHRNAGHTFKHGGKVYTSLVDIERTCCGWGQSDLLAVVG